MSDAKSSRRSKPTVRRDLYQEVTDKLIAAIEAGTAPWQRPWQDVAAAGVPMNGSSSRPYNGVNALLLMMTAQAEGYSDNRWFTFKQANAMGAKVRKGSKSTPVYFFKMLDAKGREVPGDGTAPREGQGGTTDSPRQIPFLTEYRVFHATQLEGLAPLPQPERPWTPLQSVQQLVERLQPEIRYGGNRAFYAPGPGRDFIQLPPEGAFASAEEFAGTLAHELGHWTGAEHRLNRKFGVWGTEAYMQEELRAEIFSACLCAELGVATPMDNHAAYVGAWLKKLREDKFEVFRAAKDARRMVDFVMGRGGAPVIAAPASDSAPAMLSANLCPKAVASGVEGLLLSARKAARRGTAVRRHGFVPVSEALAEHAAPGPSTGGTQH